jgi:CHASE2 domain-containing sensor protein
MITKTAVGFFGVLIGATIIGGIGYLVFGWRVPMSILVPMILLYCVSTLLSYVQEKNAQIEERLKALEQRVNDKE